MRTEASRPAASPVRILIHCSIVLALAVAAYWSGCLAWADHLARSSQPADRERAVRVAPGASLYERLADKIEETGGDPMPALAHAAELDPANAECRMRVGLRAEMAGQFDVAERNLLAAARLSRLYQPRYLLAQYYFRRQNAGGFFQWVHAAFDTAYGDVSPLLDLCWRMRPDPEWLWAHALSSRPEIARQYLVFLSRRQQVEAAEVLAGQLSESAVAADLPALLEFCDRRLAAGRPAHAVEVWNRLCVSRLLPFEELDPTRGTWLTDGRFAHQALGQGFDWRLNDTDGVTSRRMKGELRVTFSGRQAEWCGVAWQYLATRPGGSYRLRWELRGIDIDSPDGVCWKIYDLAGRRVAAETGGGSLTFVAPADVLMLMLSYERPMGSPRLAGTVAVTQVALGMER
ncbi:MAG: hypothetical protein ABSF62_00840 [Bryobacteraceae bacterium]